MTTRVEILVPVHGQVAAATAASLAHLCVRSHRLIQEVRIFGNANLTVSRNFLAERALAAGATHLLWIDADMVFPCDGLERLLEQDRPIMAANAARKCWPPDSAATALDGERLRPRAAGIEEALGMGLAFMLIERQVFEKLPRPWFRNLEAADRFVEGDVLFCGRARQAGFRIWIDHGLSAEIGHVGEHVYRLEAE